MVAIVSFIGWHNSGKTTLAARVVTELNRRGYRVAVIKSCCDKGIEFDTPGTDTYKHKQAGAESVMLVAPDQTVLQGVNVGLSLKTLAARYFSDVDIVVGEGFKREPEVPKIEVFCEVDEHLRDEVPGVVGVATKLKNVAADCVFDLDEPQAIALFIEELFLGGKKRAKVPLLEVNGRQVALDAIPQKALLALLQDCLPPGEFDELMNGGELRIQFTS